MTEQSKPIVFLLHEAQLKLKYFVDNVDGEISGLGTSYVDKTGNIVIEDLRLFHQTCSYGSTILDNNSQARFLAELQKKKEDTLKWNVWWHSHAHMEVSFSSTDTDTIEGHMGTIPYLISVVANKKGKILARLDIFPIDTSPFKKQLIHSLEDLVIINVMPQKSQTEINKLIKRRDTLDQKIEVLRNETEEDVQIEDFCVTEILEKVKQQTYGHRGKGVKCYDGNGYWIEGKFIKWGSKEDKASNFSEDSYEDNINQQTNWNQLAMFFNLPPEILVKGEIAETQRDEFSLFLDLLLVQANYVYDEIERDEIGFQYNSDTPDDNEFDIDLEKEKEEELIEQEQDNKIYAMQKLFAK